MSEISIEKCKSFSFIKVKNDKNLEVTLSSFGAGVYSLSYDNNPMILTLKKKKRFLFSYQFFGKAVGQVIGRIKKEQIINNKKVVLMNNEGELVLHGGRECLSFQDFAYEYNEDKDNINVIFYYKTKLNQSGFPGITLFTITYKIKRKEDVLEVDFDARPSQETLINLSNHMYFNFGNTALDDYKLFINASSILKCDKKLLPLEQIDIPSILDFRNNELLKVKLVDIEKQLGTIDHTFLFDNNDILTKQISLENSIYRLSIYTTYEASNIYLDNTCSKEKFINSSTFKKRRGLAIEPQHNLINRDRILYNPKKPYHDKIIYAFEKVGN